MTYNSAYTGPQIDRAARIASITFDDIADMLADARDYTAHTAGDVFWTAAEGYRYEIAASDASDHHLTTAGGVKVYVLPTDDGVYNFGAFNPAGDGVTDDYAKLVLALEATPTGGMAKTIQFDKAAYFIGSTVNIKRTVRLIGNHHGTFGLTGTSFVWPASTMGMIVNRSDTFGSGVVDPATGAGDGTRIEGIAFIGGGGTSRTEYHGLWMRAKAIVNNCAFSGFAGNGVHILATAGSDNDARQGNANYWRMTNVRCEDNRGSGVYVEGADVNAGIGIGIDCNSNGRVGIHDNSFLGNTWIGCHSATNGVGAAGGNGTGGATVSYEGSRYQAAWGATDAQLVATTPGTDSAVWLYHSAGGNNSQNYYPVWEADQTEGLYTSVAGAYIAGDTSNRCLFLGCYSEEDQAGPAFDGFSIVMGGLINKIRAGGIMTGVDGNNLVVRSVRATGNGIAAKLTADSNGTMLAFGRDDQNTEWSFKWSDDDLRLDHKNSNAQVAFRVTGDQTAETFGSGTAQPYKFHANQIGIGGRRHAAGTAAPTTGAWGRGEIVWNQSASAGGFAGWICVTAGTPGTWKQFGAIEA